MPAGAISQRLRDLAAEVENLGRSAALTRYEVKRELRLPSGSFFEERYAKDLIVLHFTAGSSVAGAVEHWKGLNDRVGTAYVIDLDGSIHEVFDPRCWAYHLGIASTAGARHDQRSIGVELVNVGPLRRREDQLCWWPEAFGRSYCRVADQLRYVEGEWRGERYWAAFTDAQYRALARLIPDLCVEHRIPFELVTPAERMVTLSRSAFEAFKGVATHQNFRADKVDVGPAFDWERLRRLM